MCVRYRVRRTIGDKATWSSTYSGFSKGYTKHEVILEKQLNN